MLRVIHGADFHLGAPCQGLPPEKAAQRRRELSLLPERLRGLAEEQSAQLMLLPGDLFDRPQGCAQEAQLLARSLGRLSIPIFISPGNHDYYSPRSPYAAIQWPENVHLFTSPAIQRVELPQLGCVVYGGAFTGPRQEASLLEGFAPQEDPGLLRILCIHGELAPASAYNPLPPRQLAVSGFHYVALGHNHTFGGAQKDGYPFCCWPGCPEGRGFDETGPKGVLSLELDFAGNSARFCPICTRQYREVTVDVTDGPTILEAVRRQLPVSPSPDIVRLVLTGESDGQEPLAPVQQLAEERYFSVSLRDETTLRRDLWSRAGEDSLTGQFLRLVRQELEGAPPEQRRQLELAARLGLAALEGREAPP